MIPSGDYPRRIHFVFNPMLSIATRIHHSSPNFVGRHTEVLFCPAKLTRPLPSPVEHSSMKLPKEGYREHVLMLTAECPLFSL